MRWVHFFLAQKYFYSRRKKGFIHVISWLSVLGVCVGTFALVVILSVFNGLEDLNRSIFKSFDPELKIKRTDNRTFSASEKWSLRLRQNPAIHHITPVLEVNALARYRDGQMVVTLHGVDSTFQKFSPIRSSIRDGLLLTEEGPYHFAVVGGGVLNGLQMNLRDFSIPLELWYPNNRSLNVLNPEENINAVSLQTSGVFSLEQRYDNWVYAPLEVVQELTEKENQITHFEVFIRPGHSIESVQEELIQYLPEGLQVLNQDQQNEALFRAIRIEKLFIFIALLFIIGIASFNIFFSLTMLVIEKREDIRILRAIGADTQLIFKLFLTEGVYITCMGAGTGLLLGIALCWLQQTYGFVSMGMSSALVDAYPVRVDGLDLVKIVAGVLGIGVLVSFFPANKAVQFLKETK